MNKLNNIIIVGDVRNVFTSYYDKENIESKDCKMFRFTNDKLPCASSELYAKDTNALYILNKYLAKIIENKKEYKQVKIYLNKSLYGKISTGKYKYWVENGMTQTGTVLDKKELEQWEIFVRLYRQVFTKINWYHTDLFNAKSFKYNKQEMDFGRDVYLQLHSKLIKKAEEDLNKKIFGNV